MLRLPLLLTLSALVGLAACGGNVVAEGTGGDGTGGNGTGANGTGGSTTSSVMSCPSVEPSAGGSCAAEAAGFACTYGDSVRPECRNLYVCNEGMWEATGSACVSPPAGDCPASQPSAQTTCANMGDVCTYGDTICACSCGGGACIPPIAWLCTPPPTTSGCPAVVPNDGTPCSVPGVQCTYGNVCSISGAQVTCTSGLWSWDMMIACAG
jgi:hypothetical protein